MEKEMLPTQGSEQVWNWARGYNEAVDTINNKINNLLK
jgi:hypothetical protein